MATTVVPMDNFRNAVVAQYMHDWAPNEAVGPGSKTLRYFFHHAAAYPKCAALDPLQQLRHQVRAQFQCRQCTAAATQLATLSGLHGAALFQPVGEAPCYEAMRLAVKACNALPVDGLVAIPSDCTNVLGLPFVAGPTGSDFYHWSRRVKPVQTSVGYTEAELRLIQKAFRRYIVEGLFIGLAEQLLQPAGMARLAALECTQRPTFSPAVAWLRQLMAVVEPLARTNRLVPPNVTAWRALVPVLLAAGIQQDKRSARCWLFHISEQLLEQTLAPLGHYTNRFLSLTALPGIIPQAVICQRACTADEPPPLSAKMRILTVGGFADRARRSVASAEIKAITKISQLVAFARTHPTCDLHVSNAAFTHYGYLTSTTLPKEVYALSHVWGIRPRTSYAEVPSLFVAVGVLVPMYEYLPAFPNMFFLFRDDYPKIGWDGCARPLLAPGYEQRAAAPIAPPLQGQRALGFVVSRQVASGLLAKYINCTIDGHAFTLTHF